jgi:hypothetical protein
LTLLLLQNSGKASFRQLLYAVAPEALPEQALPSLSTFAYRKGRLGEERLEQLVQWLAQQGIVLEQEQLPLCVPRLAIVDGTGVGYDTPFYQRYRRGKEIRRLRSHVKVVGLVLSDGERWWVVGLSLGEAYADEGRLFGRWLLFHGAGLAGEGGLLVGDKLYGYRAKLLEQIEGVGWLPVVRVEAGLHQGVRAPSRLRALSRLEAYGWALRERYRIEGLFGNVKGAYGGYSESRTYRNACVDVYARFILWNMVKLLEVMGEKGLVCLWLCWWQRLILEQPPSPLDKDGFVR